MSYDKETRKLIYDEFYNNDYYPSVSSLFGKKEWLRLNCLDEEGMIVQVLFDWGYLDE